MSVYLKHMTSSLIASLARGHDGGLNSLGKLIEKISRYLIFVMNAERLSSMNSPHFGETADGVFPNVIHGCDAGVVYDVGANNGDDVEYYLKKGMKVVAIEANPSLADHVRSRFGNDVKRGALTILNVAVGDKAGKRKFYLSIGNDKISSLLRPLGNLCDWCEVDVEVRTLSSIMREFGEPAFVKIDTEGSDAVILHEIFSSGCVPNMLSAESHTIDVFCELFAGGYRKFKIVESRFIHSRYRDPLITTVKGFPIRHTFPEGISGPFGNDLAGEWMDVEETFQYLCRYGLGWKDIHACL